ncbi:putative Retinitis pigmentosa 9 protein-like protein [Hypsibius exemplaris]|uniref:Retinitis pigmentosa 9 protein-like protein n=1 Tax=Hypsibius exemplaris TaxID=2072580 RepID=A0A1W0WD51_HYPEX|nr:putative Retinitis pigmentosa 9 protein-like protein [Hypsibius exemplaris]
MSRRNESKSSRSQGASSSSASSRPTELQIDAGIMDKLKHIDTFYEAPPPGFIKEDEERPEDSIPNLPQNRDARDFLATAPSKGLWMPLGKEVKVMQCWKCKTYGHRSGDKECPLFYTGNRDIEKFRFMHEDPMHAFVQQRKHENKKERIKQLQSLLMSSSSESESGAPKDTSKAERKKRKSKKKRGSDEEADSSNRSDKKKHKKEKKKKHHRNLYPNTSHAMAPQVAGKYEFVSGENFESYLKATGLSDEHVEIGKQLKPTIEISQNGEEWTLDIQTEVMTKKVTFKLGTEFSETTPSGKTVKSIIRKEGDKLVQTQTFENGFKPTIDLEFSDSGLTMTYTWPAGKTVRNYKRV